MPVPRGGSLTGVVGLLWGSRGQDRAPLEGDRRSPRRGVLKSNNYTLPNHSEKESEGTLLGRTVKLPGPGLSGDT